MSFANAFETDLLELLFQNVALANVGDAGGLGASAAAGSVQLALHSAALDDTATLMTANELTYTGYARPTVARSAAAWDVTGAVASNLAPITFGTMTAGGPQTAVHMSLGFLSTGDVLNLHADLVSDLIINNNINPRYDVGQLSWTLD